MTKTATAAETTTKRTLIPTTASATPSSAAAFSARRTAAGGPARHPRAAPPAEARCCRALAPGHAHGRHHQTAFGFAAEAGAMVILAFVINGFEDAVELSQARLPPDSPAAEVPPATRTGGRAAAAALTAVVVATTSTASAVAAEAGGRGVGALGPGRGRHPCRRHGTHLRLRPHLRAKHALLDRVRHPPPCRGNCRCCSHRCGPGGS